MKRYRWTPDRLAIAIKTLGEHDRLDAALPAISRRLGFPVSRSAIDCALAKQKHGSAASHLRSGRSMPIQSATVDDIPVHIVDDDWSDKTEPQTTRPPMPESVPPAPASSGRAVGHEDLSRVAVLAKKWIRRGGLTLEALCDEMGLTPAKGRELAERAIAEGYHVDIHGGVLDFREPDPVPTQERHIATPPMQLGEEIAIGVVSDPHFASKHHELDALKRHVEWLYNNGVRHIFGPGDWVAGGYRFLKYEVTHNGIEEQSSLVADFVQWAGSDLTWHAIAGNHCESHDVGIDSAKMIEQMLRARGWNNFHYHGPRAARLRFGATRIAMHHPGGGLGYALSYKIQKYIDAMPLSERPHFLFVGHTHQKLWLERGGVNGFLCGTFENGDSSFGRMLGGEVQVGGWLVRYRHDERGNVPDVTTTFRKQPHQRMNYIQVPA